jgi:hypothetical protein
LSLFLYSNMMYICLNIQKFISFFLNLSNLIDIQNTVCVQNFWKSLIIDGCILNNLKVRYKLCFLLKVTFFRLVFKIVPYTFLRQEYIKIRIKNKRCYSFRKKCFFESPIFRFSTENIAMWLCTDCHFSFQLLSSPIYFECIAIRAIRILNFIE